jgi:apolipoprotein N-acyltransferase
VISALARRLALSWGWERRWIAFGAGAFGVLAFPPFDLTPAFFVPLTCAVWLLDGCAGKAASSRFGLNLSGLRQAADVGWWLGFGFFLAGLWWIGRALLVEQGFAWALPLAVVALPAALALFMAFGFALARLMWSSGALRCLALASGLGASEWLRGRVLTGFPWNAFGMALGANDLLAQTASLYGLYGLTIMAVALFAGPAAVLRYDGRRTSWGALGVLCFAWAAIIGYGAVRLSGPPRPATPGVRLRIMQPNLDQAEKFRPEDGESILGNYLALSDRATSPSTSGVAQVTHLIWPESAFPFILSRTPEALAAIQRALPEKTVLITGAARAEENASGAIRYFNAIQVVRDGRILADYDKVHLVPFGEYLPLASSFERLGVQSLVSTPGGFTPGSRRSFLRIPGLPLVLPLICYEAIFPIETGLPAAPDLRPGLILNVTNDGWFGRTIGPYQHFAQARLRAIEEGLPLVRAANTGISAVVDPLGRVLTQAPVGIATVLDSTLPQRIPPTLFSLHPMLAEFAIWLLALIGAFLGRIRRRL